MVQATWETLLSEPTPADYPQRLAAPQPQHESLRRGIVIPLLLVVACLVPRAIMAWRVDTVCADGVIYFHLAEELERGRIDPGDVSHLQAGTFPLVLATLHRWGFEWETAAKIYGVLLATLAVLPLFGWVRRQFDDRVAVIACLLYAAHPKLIEWSPEAVREPSFWFFFLLSLYFLWRAVVEVDWKFFAAGGAATALTCLTRFEGWFLLSPLLGWTCVRLWYLQNNRLRLLAGGLCSLLAMPLVFYGFGLLLPDGAGWTHMRVAPMQRAVAWVFSWQSEPPTAAPEPTVVASEHAVAQPAPPAAVASAPVTLVQPHHPGEPDWTVRQTAAMMLNTCERGLTPLFAILMFGGYFSRARLFHRSDNLPLLVVVLAVVAGIWIHLWFAHLASSRYALTIVLISTRSAALGLLDFGSLVGRWLTDRWAQAARFATAATLAVVVLVGTVDAVTSDFKSRESLAQLGKWIQSLYESPPFIVGSESQLAVVGFYAQGQAQPFPPELTGESLANWLAEIEPDVVVISKRRQTPEQYQAVLDRLPQLGLELIAAENIPASTKNMLVLARAHNATEILHQAARTPVSAP